MDLQMSNLMPVVSNDEKRGASSPENSFDENTTTKLSSGADPCSMSPKAALLDRTKTLLGKTPRDSYASKSGTDSSLILAYEASN